MEPDARLEAGLPRDEGRRDPAEPGTSAGRLQSILDTLRGPARVVLEPGHHVLRPVEYTDPTCGNCEDPELEVPATRGLRVSGSGIEIVGVSADSVILHTRSGYGVLFEDCRPCGLRGVTVTDGIRDPDGRATDAGVVVRDSKVTVERCRLRDNVGDSSVVAETVVGVAGVAGREGAELVLFGCEITGNSWDGVALYRGATATIVGNVVDGVEAASGGEVGGGRGVGIGLTWDAAARVEGNLVRRYWKGIGVFLDARAIVRENIVEDVLTWGLSFWDAGRGRPVAYFVRNAVFHTGACGAMLARSAPADSSDMAPPPGASGASGQVGPGARLGEAPGGFQQNALVATGRNEAYDDGTPYCTQRPLAREAVPASFVVEGNLFHDNRQPGPAPRVEDLSRETFLARAARLLDRLQRRPALRESRFLETFTGPGSATAPAGAEEPRTSRRVPPRSGDASVGPVAGSGEGSSSSRSTALASTGSAMKPRTSCRRRPLRSMRKVVGTAWTPPRARLIDGVAMATGKVRSCSSTKRRTASTLPRSRERATTRRPRPRRER